MITVPTQKLYFGKFLYCLKFRIVGTREENLGPRDNTVIAGIKNLLAGSGSGYRSRLDWHFADRKTINVIFSVYISDDQLFETLKKSQYAGMIAWISKPASQLHKELLLSNTEILLRDNLLYKRFRYRIDLRVGFRREKAEELVRWVNNNFEGRPAGRKGDYMLSGNWNMSLYLIEESDLVLVRLSQSENIRSVMRVDLFSEHGIADSKMLDEDSITP